MALKSKSISANGANGKHKFTLTVNENSTSVATNTSGVSWSLVISPLVAGYDWVSNSGKITYTIVINGTTYSGIIATYDGASTVAIKSGTESFAHSADGSKTINFSFSITDASGWAFAPGNASASGTLALTNIPRQAAITDAPNFNDEQDPKITYSNPAGSVVDRLELCITLDGTTQNALPYRAIDKNGTTYTYTLSAADRNFLRSAAPNSNTLKVGFYLRTVIGGVDYFSKVWRTMTIVNADPQLAPVIRDANAETVALTGGNTLIRHVSVAYFETGAKAQKGASLVSQSVSCGGVIVEGATGSIPDVQTGDFVITATDSRGNTTMLPVQVPFVDYVRLSCSIGNDKPDTDGKFTLKASGACYVGDVAEAGSNDLYVLYRFKVSGGAFSDWMEMSVAVGENRYTATANFTGLDYQAAYTFQCKAGDLVTTVTTDEVTVKSLPVFDWSGEDFNFNVPVSAPKMSLDGVQLDYIVEQGQSSDWYFRKWSSGVMECWKSLVYKTAINNQWGSLYLSPTATPRQSYPYPFTRKPIEQVSVQANHPAWVITASNGEGVNGTYASGRYHLCSPGTYTSIEHYLSYYVIGYWK